MPTTSVPAPGRGLLAVITDDRFGSSDAERAVLEPLGVELRVADCRSSADVARACADADAVLLNMAPLDAAAVAALGRLRVVSRYGVGLDNVDQAACAARGVRVFNVPGYCDAELAEHALAMLLGLARGLPERDAAVRAGGWNIASPQRSVAGSTVGVLGFGGAGKAFARAVLGLSPARVLVWSPTVTQARLDEALGPLAAASGVAVRPASFEELMASSDFISVHLRLAADTRGIIGERSLSLVKPGAVLVNTSRGGAVDQEALVRALDSGRLSGAGLDVFAAEPPEPGDPLLSRRDVLLSDHSAYRSARSLAELRTRCARNAAVGLGLL